MSAQTQTLPTRAKLSGLLGSEARRLYHRRLVRWLLAFALALYVLIVVIVWFNHDKSGIDHPQIILQQTGLDGAVGVGVGVALIMFVIGAAYAGAEWSNRTIVALLFWEPRRWRVMGAKIAIAAAAAVVLTIAAQLLWVATAFFLASTKGDTHLASDFWPTLFNRELRVLIFTILVTWLGFGIANLVRNSAASLGVAFVYFAIVESVVIAYWHWATQWLLNVNAAALLTKGGVDLGDDPEDPGKHLSSLHGGLVWGIASIGMVTLGAWVFNRRDAS
jgi:hypothetical protein